jgi:hypothetical protein
LFGIVRFEKSENKLVLIGGKNVAGWPSHPLAKQACESITKIVKKFVTYTIFLFWNILVFVLFISNT